MPYKSKATYNGKYYENFGIHGNLLSLYGLKKEDIIEVEVEIHENQELNYKTENDIDYWGYYEDKTKDFSIIYPNRKEFSCCFGFPVFEMSKNKDKAYRLKIINKELRK